MFDWNDLRFFLAVAQCGSTLAAAKRLGTSQSTVHRRLNELERRLGRSLTVRHATGYRLTELGQVMLARAEHIEQSILSFERQVNASDQRLTGIIRVTCPETVSYRLMRSQLIEKFNVRFPELRVEIVMDDYNLDLGKGRADIAIRGAGIPTDGVLFGRKIAEVAWAIYASHDYIGRYGRIDSFADIDDHRVVQFEGLLEDHPAARWLRSTAPNALVVAQGKSLPTLLLAVKSGVALAPLPVAIGKADDDLEQLSGLIPDLIDPFYLLTHEDLKQTPRVRAFFDFVLENLELVRQLLGCRSVLRQEGAANPMSA